jgi:hypothetical protein
MTSGAEPSGGVVSTNERMRRIPRLLALLALAIMSPATAARASPDPLPELRGILVVSVPYAVRNGDFARALSVPGVDGALIELEWKQLEPQRGTYDWGPLDALLSAVAGRHLRAEVSVAAGAGTPEWVCAPPPAGEGAKRLAFRYAHHGGATGNVRDVVMAPPWDPVFLSAWDEFLTQLASHLRESNFDKIVPALRLTGINTTSDELRLAAQTPATAAAGGMTDSIRIWADAGYRPSLVREAWQKIVASFGRSFPEKSMSLALILSGAFPGIDESGRPSDRPAAARELGATLVADLVKIAAKGLEGRLVVEHLFLIADQPADAQTVAFARNTGSPLAWQTNLYLGHDQKGAAGGGSITAPVPLTEQSFRELLDRGIHPAGFGGDVRYIEVFPSDALAFPEVIRGSHEALASGRR